MMEAAQFSVNTYFIQLELATGMCRVTKMAEKTGVKVGARIGQPPVDIVKEYPGQAVIHARHRRGEPALHGRGVRDFRGPRHPLRSDHRLQDHDA